MDNRSNSGPVPLQTLTSLSGRPAAEAPDILRYKLFYLVNFVGFLIIVLALLLMSVPVGWLKRQPHVSILRLDLNTGSVSHAIRMTISHLNQETTGVHFSTHNAGHRIGDVVFGKILVPPAPGSVGRAVSVHSPNRNIMPPANVSIVDLFDRVAILTKYTKSPEGSGHYSCIDATVMVRYDTVERNTNDKSSSGSSHKTGGLGPINVNALQMPKIQENAPQGKIYSVKYQGPLNTSIDEYFPGPEYCFGNVKVGNFTVEAVEAPIMSQSIKLTTSSILPLVKITITTTLANSKDKFRHEYFTTSDLKSENVFPGDDWNTFLSKHGHKPKTIVEVFGDELLRVSTTKLVPIYMQRKPLDFVVLNVIHEEIRHTFCYATAPDLIGQVYFDEARQVPKDLDILDRVLWITSKGTNASSTPITVRRGGTNGNNPVCRIFTRTPNGTTVVSYDAQGQSWFSQ